MLRERAQAVNQPVRIPTTAAEWLTSAVLFRFKGQDWPLAFTHRSMLLCERMAGVDLLRNGISQPSSILLRAMLFSLLSGAGAAVTLEEAGRALSRQFLGVRTVMVQAWLASMPDPEPGATSRAPAKDLTWADIWATARYELNLGFEEWLDLTPRLFRALEKARLRRMQREELLNAMVAAQIENWSYHAPKRATSYEKFMLHPFEETDKGEDGGSRIESHGAWNSEDEKYCTGEYVMGVVQSRAIEAINMMKRRR
jgi:hypothetical protein